MLLLPNPTPIHQRSSSASTLSYALDNSNTASSEQGQSRAWKLWLLLPRMLLQRPPGVRMLSKDDWRTRIEHFQQGQWIYLLARAHHQAQAITPNSPPDPSLERQATRARQLVHLGELSAARQALTAGPLAPGTAETLQELRDPTRRPNEPYASLHPSLSEFQPDQPPWPKPIPPTPSYQSTASGPTTTYPATACCKGSVMSLKLIAVYPSLRCSMEPHPITFGTVPQAKHT